MTLAFRRATDRSIDPARPALRLAKSVPKMAKFWQREESAAVYRWLFPEVALTPPAPSPTPARRRFDTAVDWRRAAPRWLLIAITAAASAGWYEATTARQSRLEEAIADAPSKTQARADTRLAVIESRMDAYEARENARAAKTEQTIASMVTALSQLTIEVREMKVEARMRRKQ